MFHKVSLRSVEGLQPCCDNMLFENRCASLGHNEWLGIVKFREDGENCCGVNYILLNLMHSWLCVCALRCLIVSSNIVILMFVCFLCIENFVLV